MGILDTIIDNSRKTQINTLSPDKIIESVLSYLKPREREVIAKRHGLLGHEVETLEAVGKTMGLTRERVRQIEKNAQKFLKEKLQNHEVFAEIRLALSSLIHEQGSAVAEHRLLKLLKTDSEKHSRSVLFLLGLINELERVGQKTGKLKPAWIKLGFEMEMLVNLIEEAKSVLSRESKPIKAEDLITRLRAAEQINAQIEALSDEILSGYLEISAEIEKNLFNEFGLSHWSEIRPRDVGDKAYLALKYSGKPEHYSQITELINKLKLGPRAAFKETVHNELIKDSRFVLIGRGIYALAEWGYRSGVVADVITEILKEAGRPLTRDEIIEEVGKRRMVKRNTILVGLANKKIFKKSGKNSYELVNA
ncbi:MAG TPA: sigma factor-like helix-turn-helix DNA-binding protein [Patescibacteria group bacterium]|nr:sigma factor-like helix-turn-helix DNA-binding protein [Patescibacteria group bacterium]